MRVIVYMLIFLNSFFVLGQKNDVAIKIYLEDAYSGKNITDAKGYSKSPDFSSKK